MTKVEIIIACCWVRETVETSRPSPRQQTMNWNGEQGQGPKDPERDLEPEEHYCERGQEFDHPDQRVGHELAHDDRARCQGRHQKLLHGPDLGLTHDGHRRQHHGHDEDDRETHPGDHVVAAHEVRVVEDFRPQLEGRAGALSLGGSLQHSLGIGETEGAAHGVRAVGHNLHASGATGCPVGGKSGGNGHGDLRRAGGQEVVEGILGVHRGDPAEVGGGGEVVDELAAAGDRSRSRAAARST